MRLCFLGFWIFWECKGRGVRAAAPVSLVAILIFLSLLVSPGTAVTLTAFLPSGSCASREWGEGEGDRRLRHRHCGRSAGGRIFGFSSEHRRGTGAQGSLLLGGEESGSRGKGKGGHTLLRASRRTNGVIGGGLASTLRDSLHDLAYSVLVLPFEARRDSFETSREGSTVEEVLDALGRVSVVAPASTYSYNQLITACSRHSDFGVCQELFREMKAEGLSPNRCTFNALLFACIRAKGGSRVDDALLLFAEMKGMGITPDVQTFKHMVATAALAPGGSKWELARSLAREMRSRGICADGELYKYLISAAAMAAGGCPWERVLSVFNQMRADAVVPDEQVYRMLITSFATAPAGSGLNQAMTLFREMKAAGVAGSALVYKILINGTARATGGARWERAVTLFEEMKKEGIEPDEDVYTVLIGCAALVPNSVRVEKARELFVEMQRRGMKPDGWIVRVMHGWMSVGTSSSSSSSSVSPSSGSSALDGAEVQPAGSPVSSQTQTEAKVLDPLADGGMPSSSSSFSCSSPVSYSPRVLSERKGEGEEGGRERQVPGESRLSFLKGEGEGGRENNEREGRKEGNRASQTNRPPQVLNLDAGQTETPSSLSVGRSGRGGRGKSVSSSPSSPVSSSEPRSFSSFEGEAESEETASEEGSSKRHRGRERGRLKGQGSEKAEDGTGEGEEGNGQGEALL